MGYQTIKIPGVIGKPDETGFSMFTVTFKDVNGEGLPINKIKVLNSAMKEMDGDDSVVPTQKSQNKVQLSKLIGITNELDDDQTYQFTSRNGIGWHNLTKMTTTIPDTITLAPGEAAWVANSQEDDVYFQLKSPLTGTYGPVEEVK